MCVCRETRGRWKNGGGRRECEEWGNKRAREKEISNTKELIEALAAEMFERSEAIRKRSQAKLMQCNSAVLRFRPTFLHLTYNLLGRYLYLKNSFASESAEFAYFHYKYH